MHTHDWIIRYGFNSILGRTEMVAICDADPFDCEDMLDYDEIHKRLNSHADLLEALEFALGKIIDFSGWLCECVDEYTCDQCEIKQAIEKAKCPTAS